MNRDHRYAVALAWTGNLGTGTQGHGSYSRDHEVTVEGVAPIAGSSDVSFRGDPARWNPEQLLLASVAQCHMLWYLSLAASAGITVVEYADQATGLMTEHADGAGQFVSVTLRPEVTIADAEDTPRAHELHDQVGSYCFVARSVNFPIRHEVTIRAAGDGG